MYVKANKARSLSTKLLTAALLLCAAPVAAQTYSPAEQLSYDAALSESIDDYHNTRIQDKDLLRKRYRAEVEEINALYLKQTKGLKDPKALMSYKRERQQKLSQAAAHRAAVDEASEDVLQKKLKDRKAYLRTLPYRKK